MNNMQMVQRGLGFVNDLKIDSDRKHIWIVSNNLPTYIYTGLNYSQFSNFRFMRASIQRALAKSEVCNPEKSNNIADEIDVRGDNDERL